MHRKLAEAFKQHPARLARGAVSGFVVGAQLHAPASWVRTEAGAVTALWPQQIERDKRIPALG